MTPLTLQKRLRNWRLAVLSFPKDATSASLYIAGLSYRVVSASRSSLHSFASMPSSTSLRMSTRQRSPSPASLASLTGGDASAISHTFPVLDVVFFNGGLGGANLCFFNGGEEVPDELLLELDELLLALDELTASISGASFSGASTALRPS